MTRVGDANVYDYSGGTLKAAGSVLYIFGGGHAGTGDNGVYALRLQSAAPSWSVVNAPSADVPPGPYNGNGGLVGKPRARHTYGSARFSDKLNKMMVFGYAFDLNSNTYSVTDALDGDTGEWAAPGTYGAILGGGTPGTHVVQTNSGDMYFWTNGWGLQKWSPAAQFVISDAKAADPGLTYNSGALGYDSSRDVIVSFAATGARRYDVANGLSSVPVTFTNDRAGAVGDGFWVYVPELDSYLGVHGGSDSFDPSVFEVDAKVSGTTYAVKPRAIAGVPPSSGPLGGKGLYYGRWGYAPELRLVYFAFASSSDVYVFKVR